MSNPTTGKIGGEYGDVRATIDLRQLDAYLQARVPEITAPVTVKQFKVFIQVLSRSEPFSYGLLDLVWAGTLQ